MAIGNNMFTTINGLFSLQSIMMFIKEYAGEVRLRNKLVIR